MAITYSGITPTLLFDTSDLQNTEKLSKVGGQLVKNRNGVCLSMVIDWIQKSIETTGGVTDKSQLKSGLSLALMQTAYMRDVFDEDGLIDTQGLTVNTSTEIRQKKGLKGLFQKNPVIQIATALAGMNGYALINIFGGGFGHGLGFKQRAGTVQFYDPNEGIMQFASAQDFAKWFPSYIKGEYPNMRERIELKKVTG